MLKLVGTGLLTLGLLTASLAGLVSAQDRGTGAGGTDDSRSTQRVDDDDSDYGWVGLLGLAGLAGLMRRDRDRHAHHTGTTGTAHR